MVEQEFRLANPAGLHARPAALFVKMVAGLRSEVRVANLDRDPATTADARSIIAVLSLGASRGSRIRVTVEGPSEAQDLAAIARLVASGLGETVPDLG